MDIVTKRIKVRGIPDAWKDRIKMQSLYSLEDKGYKKKVYWEKSTIDSSFAGIFAEEYIMKGEIIRVLEKDVTMIVFNGKEDLPPLTETFMDYFPEYIGSTDDICHMFVPGIGCNHHVTKANIWFEKYSDRIVHVIALKDISKGEELLHDYHDNGTPPEWLSNFAKEHNKHLNYKEFCDFI